MTRDSGRGCFFCGYPLPEPVGARVCPECGRRQPIGEPIDGRAVSARRTRLLAPVLGLGLSGLVLLALLLIWSQWD
jgi:hypothetical protein